MKNLICLGDLVGYTKDHHFQQAIIFRVSRIFPNLGKVELEIIDSNMDGYRIGNKLLIFEKNFSKNEKFKDIVKWQIRSL